MAEPTPDAPKEPLKTLRLDRMVSDIAASTGEPEAVVSVVLNLFLESFVEELESGRKIRLGEFGAFQAGLLPDGRMQIKHRR